MPISRAASTTARTESLPRRWPSGRESPRWRAHRPFPSITIATWRGSRSGSSDRAGNSLSGSDEAMNRGSRRGIPPRGGRLARGSDLHYLGFLGRQHFVDLLDVFGGMLLDLSLGGAQRIVIDFFVLMHFLELVVGVAAMVAHRNPEFLGGLVHVAHQFLAPLLGQFRNRHADDLAVVDRS